VAVHAAIINDSATSITKLLGAVRRMVVNLRFGARILKIIIVCSPASTILHIMHHRQHRQKRPSLPVVRNSQDLRQQSMPFP
jgi:hypothetical protein